VSAQTYPGTFPALQALPITGISVAQLSVSPAFRANGQPFNVTITLDTISPPGSQNLFGVRATVSPTFDLGIDTLIRVPSGSTSAAVSVTIPTAPTLQNITWQPFNQSTPTATTTLAPPEVSALTLGGATILGGQTLSGNRATIAAQAPIWGGVSLLIAGSPGTVSPATPAVVLPGSNQVTFDLVFSAVAQPTTVTVSARSYNRPEAVVRTATITVQPPALQSLTLGTTPLPRNTTVTGTVQLNAIAPVGGAVVSLSASPSFAVSLPSSVTVPSGSTSAQFQIQVGSGGQKNLTITATYRGASMSQATSIQ
jgi:hypothetical protein